jgi:hypothetical protein
MTGSGTATDPYTEFTPEMADEHWSNGNGETVYIDMASHMNSGGGSVFSPGDFATPFGQAVDGLPAGTTVRFETNKSVRIETNAERATATHSYYASDGLLSDGAFVWGNTAAGFRGTVTVMENGNIYVEGEIRPFNEQFDYSANTWNPFLEAARLAGRFVAGPGTAYDIVFIGENGLLISGEFSLHEFAVHGTYIMFPVKDRCFLGDTPIKMWPLDPSSKPRADGSYDEAFVLSKVWEKPISEIKVGDIVVAYDDKGRLGPKRVLRTMENRATHILDFWGTGTTPGHAYHCADGPSKGGHAPIMDILRMDGAIMRADGTMIRAATYCKVGSMGDMMIHASATLQKPDGTWTEPKKGKVRFGTRIILPDGRHMSFMEMASSEGWRVSDDGYMVGMMEDEDGELQEQKFLFPYAYGEELPKPEAYILARSAVTLEEIYAAGEWEQIGTRLPAPAGMVGLNTNQTSRLLQPSKPQPNIPPAFANRPDAPVSNAQRAARPAMNRKQRKAMEAKTRKAAKMSKRVVN